MLLRSPKDLLSRSSQSSHTTFRKFDKINARWLTIVRQEFPALRQHPYQFLVKHARDAHAGEGSVGCYNAIEFPRLAFFDKLFPVLCFRCKYLDIFRELVPCIVGAGSGVSSLLSCVSRSIYLQNDLTKQKNLGFRHDVLK